MGLGSCSGRCCARVELTGQVRAGQVTYDRIFDGESQHLRLDEDRPPVQERTRGVTG
jgi:hypothetical protein